LECDIHLSKDKQLVVFHDNTLERTTNGHGWIKDLSLSELKKLDAGQGETIATLEEVVNLVMAYNKRLIIEIKGESWELAEETTDSLINYLQNSTFVDKFIIHSFWHEAVKKIKEKYPNLTTAVIMMLGLTPQKMIDLILSAKANGASIAYDYISPELVQLATEKSLFLDAWVLDYEVTFQKMKDMGVNGLITNFPGKFSL
jgi:glycerophosphoryl diester phosphodiesterase